MSLLSPVDIVPEVVVRGVRDDAAEADREREEALRNGGIPHGRLQELRPLRCDEVENTVDRAVQGDRADQQRDEHDVREDRQEIGESPGALHALEEHRADRRPAAQ